MVLKKRFMCQFTKAFQIGSFVRNGACVCVVCEIPVCWWGMCMVCLGNPHPLKWQHGKTNSALLLFVLLGRFNLSVLLRQFYCFCLCTAMFSPHSFWLVQHDVRDWPWQSWHWLSASGWGWPALPSTSRAGKAWCQQTSQGNIASRYSYSITFLSILSYRMPIKIHIFDSFKKCFEAVNAPIFGLVADIRQCLTSLTFHNGRWKV